MEPDAAARTLGVDPGASSEAVRAAYRMRARQLHPDLGGADPSAMSELNEAYRTLRSGRRAPGLPPIPDDVNVGTAVEDDVELGPSSVRLRRFIIATVVLLGLAMLMVYLAAAGYWEARYG